MRHRFLPLLLSAASLGVFVATGRGATTSSGPENAFRTGAALRFSPEVEEESQALRQSLFKNPSLGVIEPRSRPQTLPARPRTPAAPQPSRPPARSPVIAPPPQPREISLAIRELTLQPAVSTPYDRYSGTVRTVIARVNREPPSMTRVRALMDEAHDFRYRMAHPYLAALPENTAAARAGDCKAKALWLYDQLGDSSAFYVIGKTFKGAKSNHAWLYWRCDSRWWILDPTNRSTPIPADSIPNNRYEPWYSFGKGGAYRHRVSWIGLVNSAPGAPAVSAPGSRARVARK